MSPPPIASPTAAIATSEPARAAALLMPDAVPLIPSGTAFNTVVVRGATAIVMPTLMISSPGNTPLQYDGLRADRPSTTKPAAVIAGPIASGARDPKRPTRPP